VSPTACRYRIPAVLREFKESYPGYQISIQPGVTPVVVDLSRQLRIDLAVALKPRRVDDMKIHALFADELKFMVAPAHPWARAGRVDRDSIARQNVILYQRSSRTFQLVDDYFHRERMTLNTVMELGSMDAIKELVKLGLGVSVLAPWVAARELARGELVVLPRGGRVAGTARAGAGADHTAPGL
jgi:DNA-binding transcriptional LysR family regulator